MAMTTSPVAVSSAAVSAAWWPKLRESRTPTTRGSVAAASTIRSNVRSVLPSSTKTISCGPPGRSSSTADEPPNELGEHLLLVVDGDRDRDAGLSHLAFGLPLK